MSDTELLQKIQALLLNDSVTLVKVALWCERTGDTADAVHGRRKRKEWIDGVHCHIAGGALWIDTVEAQKWVKNEERKLKSVA